MITRSLFVAVLLAVSATPSLPSNRRRVKARSVIALPTLRASVTVADDIVRVGDLVDNAGSSRADRDLRAPDLGTTGTLPVAQVAERSLRAHQIIGVDTPRSERRSPSRGWRARSTPRRSSSAVARAAERRYGLGNAADIALTFDRDPATCSSKRRNTGDLAAGRRAATTRATRRFDVTFEIGNDAGSRRRCQAALHRHQRSRPSRPAILTRSVERGDVLKASDVIVERRPKAEVGNDAAIRDSALGMQVCRQIARRPRAARSPTWPSLISSTRDQNGHADLPEPAAST